MSLIGSDNPNYRHGHKSGGSTSPTSHSWACMIQRATNPNLKAWINYGGRGITVCDRWRKFENFLADMGLRPDGTSLDRINNDGHYEPGNCRWATLQQQATNKRSNKRPSKVRKDLTGKKFARLTVAGFSHRDANRCSHWHCLCECGNEKVVLGASLVSNTTKSCGCLKSESARSGAILRNRKRRLSARKSEVTK